MTAEGSLGTESSCPSKLRWERLRKTASLFVGSLLSGGLSVAPLHGLSPIAPPPRSGHGAGYRLLARRSDPPVPATALLGVPSCVVLCIATAKGAFSPFADPIVSLFIGSFILAEGLRETDLDRRVALTILSTDWIRRRPVRIFFALGACPGASFGFTLPFSAPPNVIVYGPGLVLLTRMVCASAIRDLCGFAVIWLPLRLAWA